MENDEAAAAVAAATAHAAIAALVAPLTTNAQANLLGNTVAGGHTSHANFLAPSHHLSFEKPPPAPPSSAAASLLAGHNTTINPHESALSGLFALGAVGGGEFDALQPPAWADTSIFDEAIAYPSSQDELSEEEEEEADELEGQDGDGTAQASEQAGSSADPRAEGSRPDDRAAETERVELSTTSAPPHPRYRRRGRKSGPHYTQGPLTSSEKRAFRRLLKLSGYADALRAKEEAEKKRQELEAAQEPARPRQSSPYDPNIVPSSSQENTPEPESAPAPKPADEVEESADAVGHRRKLLLTLGPMMLPDREPGWLRTLVEGTRLQNG